MPRAYKVVEVLKSGRNVSVAPAHAKVLGSRRCVAKQLTYGVGAKTEAVVGSCGIFVFPQKRHAVAFAESEVRARKYYNIRNKPLAVLSCKASVLDKRNYRLLCYCPPEHTELSLNDYQDLLADCEGAFYVAEKTPEGTHTTPWVIPLKKVWPKETAK